jgi:hypothetical protein
LGLIIMAQFHHVVYFDTADELWHVDPQTDAYFPDGEVWGYTSYFHDGEGYEEEWRGLDEHEVAAYVNAAHDLAKYLNQNPHLEI